MYGVSEAYKTAIAAASRTDRITGTITLADASTVSITDANIEQGSLYIDDRCIPGSDIDVGAVEASEMGIGLLLDDDLEGATIELTYGLDIGGDVYEDVPLGKWYPIECPRQNNVVRVLAADGMVLLEQPVGTPPASGSPYDYLAYACTAAGVTLKNTEAAISALPNGTMTITYPAESEIETLRDLVMWVTCLLSGFAWINRDGDLEIRCLTGASVRTITDAVRDNTYISDIVKTITSVATTANGSSYEAVAALDDGGIVVMDDNPLIRGESGANIGAILTAMLGELDGISYRPFSTELLRSDPALEPGDLVTLTGGVAGAGTPCLVTHSHWAYRGKQALTGAGRDSIIGAIKTQEDKKTVIKANKAYVDEVFAREITADRITVGPLSTFEAGYDPSTKETPAGAQAKADAAYAAAQSFTNSVAAGLQSQIDGSVTVWFKGYVPTLLNVPASDWNTTALKNQHLADICYDTTTGYAYRFLLDLGVYSWVRITDSDVTKALADAAAAQDTADGKRRVFTATPTVPYDVGDLWTAGPTGDLKRCIVQRLTGVYTATDWELASKYTDDTAANAAAAAAANAQGTANAAKAYTDNLASDAVITPDEKLSLKQQWELIVAEAAV